MWPLRTASGLMMLKVRCDNVDLLEVVPSISVKQRMRGVMLRSRELRVFKHDAKDGLDMVCGVRRLGGGWAGEPALSGLAACRVGVCGGDGVFRRWDVV